MALSPASPMENDRCPRDGGSDAGAGDADGMLNPYARLARDPDDAGAIRVVALRRERGWERTIVGAAVQPALYALLERLLAADADLELDEDDLTALRGVGLWVRPDEVPDEVHWHAPLDPADASAAPRVTAAGDERELIVHPGLRDAPPAGVEAPPRTPPTVWLDDARSGIATPWIAGALEPVVRGLVPGAPAPATLDDPTRAALARAGVLVRAAELAGERTYRAAELEVAARKFAADGYALMPQLLPARQVAALQRYLRDSVAAGQMRYGDPQVPRRWAQHNDPIARMFLTALTPIVQSVVGIAIKPAYAYAASYREGALLKVHVDRAQCELSITYLVDYEPMAGDVCPWPLWVRRDPHGPGTALYQRINDGIVYRGNEIYHSRDALPAGHRSAHLFLHWVRADFSGSLD